MLIKRHMLRAARQMQTYGELRPGFLEHDAANHTGPPHSSGPSTPSPLPSAQDANTAVEISMAVIEDPETGEWRAAQE